jgi:hypothetical protein
MFSSSKKICLRVSPFIFTVSFLFLLAGPCLGQDPSEKEAWMVHPQFQQLMPDTIAVLPMDNFSLEPDVEKALYNEVYTRLISRGYSRIKVEKVQQVMADMGIQTPGQLQGISLERLAQELGCEAVLRGRVDQSAAVHSVTFDAVVVSCSLWLQDCDSGQTLWQTEQWRTAHRQWQIDPVNMLLNFFGHENESRENRVAYLVHEMLKTLPNGPVQIEFGDLLNQATEITADTH